jgi:hypothetical protein
MVYKMLMRSTKFIRFVLLRLCERHQSHLDKSIRVFLDFCVFALTVAEPDNIALQKF